MDVTQDRAPHPALISQIWESEETGLYIFFLSCCEGILNGGEFPPPWRNT
jgi:hypothetical protein